MAQNNPKRSQNKKQQTQYRGKAKFDVEAMVKANKPLEISNLAKPPEQPIGGEVQGKEQMGEPEIGTPEGLPKSDTDMPKPLDTKDFSPLEQEEFDPTKEPAKKEEPTEEENPDETQDMDIEGQEGEESTEQAEEQNPEPSEDAEGPEDQLKEQAEQEVKQKVSQQIKARAKKIWQDIAKKFSKEALKAAGKAVWTFIVAYWPYILIALVIIFLILLLISNCYKGKTPYTPLDPKRDKQTVIKVLAADGDKGAQREVIIGEANSAKQELAKLPTSNAEAKAIIDQINKLLDEIITLSDNSSAINERIKKILELLDKLKTLLPDRAAAIDNIKNILTGIDRLLEYYKTDHLILNPKDAEYIRNYDIDRRIAIMLLYLVTPTDQNGAGYERIKVKRIKFSYDTERKSLSKETDYSEKDEPNISAHFTGQAADIIEIDNIKCTQIKRRRLLSDLKSKLAPIPIKVAWQSEQGYAQAGGPQAFGENMHQVFNNLGSGAIDDILIAQISDILGVDLDPNKLKGRSLQEITRYVGVAILKENLGIPGDYEMGNNLEDIAASAGRAYIANSLKIPIDGVKGNSPEELIENIGRATVEQQMNLPAGSLEGKNSDEIFASVGRRKMEESLEISRGSLSVPFDSSDSFRRNLGQGKVEASLGIKARTFYGDNIEDFKKRVGKDLFETTFANPEMIDNWLGIATGTTQNMINGNLSPNSYNREVGQKVWEKQFEVYQKEGKRAEVFGVDSGDLQRLANGDSGAFVPIGKTTIAKTLSASEQEQALIRSWFDSKQLPKELDENYLAGQFDLRDGDLGKIFVDDLGSQVFQRVGQVTALDNLKDNPSLNEYVSIVQDYQFYRDRIDIIKNNFEYIEKSASDPEVRSKATETINLLNQALNSSSIAEFKKTTKQIQKNIKFIQDKAGGDSKLMEKIKAIQKAVNEIIEGKEISDFDTLSADSIKAPTDPQVGLTKKDILNLLTGRKKVDDLIYSIGLRKWEIELDLPDGSLKNAYDAMKKDGSADLDDTLLVSIGKARVDEYGNVKLGNAETVDNNLGLPKGTTADYRAGKMTEEAYYRRVGMGSANNIAAALLNQQLDLKNDPNYALSGTDITKMLNGGWFYVALKIGGRGIDEALGFPAGGTMDVIQQTDNTDNIINRLAEMKLGVLTGLDRPVSINGDIAYNLGQAKIEQKLGLKNNELNDDNVVAKIKDYTNSDPKKLSMLDAALNLKSGTSRSLIEGGTSPHDYIIAAGNYLRDATLYDQIAKYAPWLQNKEIKDAVIALAEQTGSPQDILEAAGANRIGQVLGLNYPISIRGNFKDNLGAAKIENRLGLLRDSFKDNIDTVINLNGQNRFESAFYIEKGQLDAARKADSDYWTDEHNNLANTVDAILNIPGGTTKDFLTGAIDLGAYVDKVGQSSLTEVSVEKIADLLELDDKYKGAAETLVNIFNTDPSLSNVSSQRELFGALMGVAGLDLDNMTRFDPGTWEKILFVDPNDPDNSGIQNADKIILEQGKKWLPKWLGMDEKWDSYIDLIYEKASGINDEEKMADAIMDITKIPDKNDAKRFLNGDIKGGLTAWGAAQIVEMYNKEFGSFGFTISYADAKKAYFNDPEAEKAIGEAAVAKAEQEAGTQLSDDAKNEIRQAAIREARDGARKDLQYKVVDMQLHKLDENIPAGFTKAMREGTAEEKWGMGLTYIGNLVHSNNPSIPAEIMPELQQYFDPNSSNYHNADAFSGTTYSFLDNQMKSWFGDFIQPGTAKALMQYGKTGNLGNANEQGTLAQIYTDYGINIVTNWADKAMDLPSGTTKLAYDYFTKYQAALKTYQEARIALDAAKVANDAAKVAAAQEAANKSEAALNSLKAEAISTIITFAFQKQLAQMDASLGLVPGSSAMLVGMGVQAWITGAISPWSIGLFVITNLFGVYKIDVTCTACGYYPKIDNISENVAAQSCPLGEFNGKSEDSFQQNAIKAAQYKVNKLIADVLAMPQKLNDKSMLPTQIMTYRQEDIDSLSGSLSDLYGPGAAQMNSGAWSNELMWDHIHIGY